MLKMEGEDDIIMDELKKEILTLVFIFTILSTIFTILPTMGNPGLAGPGMDDYYAVIVPSPDTQLAKFLADEIQVIDVPTFDDIAALRAKDPPYFVHGPVLSGWFEYYDINVGGYKRYPDDPNKWGHFPLNSTHFRRAIAYLTNIEQVIATDPQLKGFSVRNYAWLGKLMGKWVNDRAPGDPLAVERFDYSTDNAIDEMFLGEFDPKTGAGVSISQAAAKADPLAIDHWDYEPSGAAIGPTGTIRTLEMYGFSFFDWMISMSDTWATELENIGIHTTKTYGSWFAMWPKISRGKFDIGVFDTFWTGDPFIMDLYFASWNQPDLATGSPCCNWRFINDTEADEWITTYGSTTNETLALEAAHKLQQKIASEAWMPAALTWIGYTAYHPDLLGIYRSSYTTDRGLGYFQSSWWTPEEKAAHDNAIKIAWLEEPEDLNPNMQAGVTASWLLALLIDGYGSGLGLTVTDMVPWSPTYLSAKERKPWIAYDWTVDTWEVSPTVNGTKTTYYLSKDVYWHDGVQFTADDVKFSLEYLRDHGHAAGQSRFTTGSLVNVTVTDVGTSSTNATGDGWAEAVVYHSKTGLFLLGYTSAWAAVLPKHIWEGVADPLAINPWTVDNPDPDAAAIGLTMLVGTGRFVYHKDDWVTGEYIRFRAAREEPLLDYPGYFKSAEDSIADINFDFGVTIRDAIPVTAFFGAMQGDADYRIHYDINVNGKVDIFDVGLLLANFGKTW